MAVLETVPEDADAHLLGGFPVPPWLDRKELHRSHRSQLLATFTEHCGPLSPDVPDDLDYAWPVAES